MRKLPPFKSQLSMLVLSSTLTLTLYGCGGNGGDDTSGTGATVGANQSAECTAQGAGTGTATGTGAGTGAASGSGSAEGTGSATGTGTGSGTGSGSGSGSGTGTGTGAAPSGPTGTPLDAVLSPLAGVVGQLMALGGAQNTSTQAVEEGSTGSGTADAAASSGVSTTTSAGSAGCSGSGTAAGSATGTGSGTDGAAGSGTGSATGTATGSSTGSGTGSGSSASGSGSGSAGSGGNTTPSVGGGFVRTAGTLTECFPADYNTTGKMVSLSYNGKEPSSGATYTLTQDYVVQDGKLENYPSSKLYKTRQVVTIFGTVTDQLVDLYTIAIGSTAEQYGFNSVTTISGQRATLDERYVPKYVLNYDLKVGETSEAIYTIESKGTSPNGQTTSGSKQSSYKIKYLGNTTVTVPAGTFVNACQVEINSNGNVAIQTVSRNTGLMVRLSRPNGFVEQELVSAKVNGAAVNN